MSPTSPTSRFVPVLELPDDWSGAVTVVVQRRRRCWCSTSTRTTSLPDAPRHVLGVLDGAACWAVDIDGDGIPDIDGPRCP